MAANGYTSGSIERNKDGNYVGNLTIEGIDLSPVQGVLFSKEGKNYLWLRRCDKVVYDPDTNTYSKKKREPRLEAYLEKQMDGNVVAYKGEFFFLRFRFSICAVWDSVLGMETNRMNLFVDRMPQQSQTIINNIANRKHGK